MVSLFGADMYFTAFLQSTIRRAGTTWLEASVGSLSEEREAEAKAWKLRDDLWERRSQRMCT